MKIKVSRVHKPSVRATYPITIKYDNKQHLIGRVISIEDMNKRSYSFYRYVYFDKSCGEQDLLEINESTVCGGVKL